MSRNSIVYATCDSFARSMFFAVKAIRRMTAHIEQSLLAPRSFRKLRRLRGKDIRRGWNKQ